METEKPKFLDGNEIWASIQKSTNFPLSASISLTNSCNFSCAHCEVDINTSKKQLSLSSIKSVLDQLADVGVLSLILTGGEPTLRKDLVEIIGEASERNFWTKLKTNAYLIDDEYREKILDTGLDRIDVSIYHNEAQKHDAFVGKEGAHERAMEAMAFFSRKRKLESVASVIAMKWNFDSIIPLVERLDDSQIRYAVDAYLAEPSKSCLNYAMELNFEELKIIFKKIGKERSNALRPALKQANSMMCSAGSGLVHINHDGEIWPCQRLRIPLGNVLDGSFRSQWISSSARKRIVSTRWKDLPECSNCKIASYCSRCPAIVLNETGNITGKCRQACKIAEAKKQALFTNEWEEGS